VPLFDLARQHFPRPKAIYCRRQRMASMAPASELGIALTLRYRNRTELSLLIDHWEMFAAREKPFLTGIHRFPEHIQFSRFIWAEINFKPP
jgi:hypothetical protein